MLAHALLEILSLTYIKAFIYFNVKRRHMGETMTSVLHGTTAFCMAALFMFLHPGAGYTQPEQPGTDIELENVTYTLSDTDIPGVKKYVMEADFKAPKERVCGVICDYYNHNTFMPSDVHSRVMGGDAQQIKLEFILDLPWPFADLQSILLIDFDKEKARARWESIGGNIKRNDGTIEIDQRGEYSHVTQTTYLDIGRYYPDWFIRVYTRTMTYRIMRAIRDRIEERESQRSNMKDQR